MVLHTLVTEYIMYGIESVNPDPPIYRYNIEQ